MLAGGADAEQERVPELVEVLVPAGDDERVDLDVAEPGPSPEGVEPGLVERARLALGGSGLERPRRLPEGAQQLHPAREIPGAGRDDAARVRDAGHLGNPGLGVVHEVDDELRERRVERVVRPRQILGGCALQVGARHPLGARVQQRRGVGARNVVGADAAGELFGQDAGAAADVDDALPGLHPREVGERRRQLARVAAHETVVRVTRDVEAHAPERIRRSLHTRHGPVTDTRAGRRYARLGEEAGRTLYPARRTWRRRRRQYTPPP